MKKLTFALMLAACCSLLALLVLPERAVFAHQPYCEEDDLTTITPWQVPDASISYAYFGSLYPGSDVDYFAFEAAAGQSVLLSLSIPAIEGFEDYRPTLVVMGPGLERNPSTALPADVQVPVGQGAMVVPVGDEPLYWFEPFGGRYYYNWDDYFFKAPKAATYTVAIWHPSQKIGHYAFVVGQKEVRGGDPDCRSKLLDYWKPLTPGVSPYPEVELAAHMHRHADGSIHDHSQLLAVDSEKPPSVDLRAFPLDDGTYNIQIRTTNFTFAPQKVGSEAVDGQGHAYLYIDDEKIARIYGEWFHLESLPEDAKELSVGLYANNHQPLGVGGKAISDSVMVAELVSTAEVAVTK